MGSGEGAVPAGSGVGNGGATQKFSLIGKNTINEGEVIAQEMLVRTGYKRDVTGLQIGTVTHKETQTRTVLTAVTSRS